MVKISNKKYISMFSPHVSERAVKLVVRTLRSRWIGQGPKIAEFEKKFKKIVKAPYSVTVNRAASGIRLALAVARVGPGDEVITTPQTCTATNHPILEQFAKPVFADIQYLTSNIDPQNIEKRITPKTKAIICVDLGGYPCDLDEINKIAKKHHLTLIEDASDAIGARYKGRPIGSLSPFTIFSFGAVQQITTGEGGMLCLKNKKDYETALRRRWFGIDRIRRKPNLVGYYDFDVWEAGYCYYMTDINAAMGIAHLDDLPKIIARRRKIANRYREELRKVPGIILFENKADRLSSYQLFTIHVENRNDFCKTMHSKGIDVSIVHERNDIYSVFGGLRKDLPNLDRFSKTNISIPIHSNLDDEDVNYIIKSIKQGW